MMGRMEAPKQSTERSPNYPTMKVADALEVAGKLWNEARRTPVSHDAAATAMGYKSLSGPARSAISTLRQYGLVEKVEKGHIRLTPLAVNALHGSPEERQDALSKIAVNPALFRELAQTHRDAGETVVRSHLITKKGFIDDGASRAAKVFRDAIQLAKPESSGYISSQDDEEPKDMEGIDAGRTPKDGLGSGGSGKPTDGVLALNVPFGSGNISVQIRTTGSGISAAHLARVRKYLELAEEDLRDSAIKQTGQYPTRDE